MMLCRRAWLLPVLEPFLPHVLARLQATWAPLLATSGKSGAKLAAATGTATTEDAGSANQEVITERLVRELTTEHLILLRCMQDPTPPPGHPDGERQCAAFNAKHRKAAYAATSPSKHMSEGFLSVERAGSANERSFGVISAWVDHTACSGMVLHADVVGTCSPSKRTSCRQWERSRHQGRAEGPAGVAMEGEPADCCGCLHDGHGGALVAR